MVALLACIRKFTVIVMPLVLRSLGSIPPETKMALTQLGFSRKETS
jgi:hypothetical protein